MSSASAPDIPDDDHGPPEVNEIEDVPEIEGIGGPFFQKIGKRKRENRDAKILVTGDHAQTGIGKSNCCDFLAYVCDTTDEGFQKHKISINPKEFFEAYKHTEKGSAMVLEEAEQLDARRHMSNENVESSKVWQQERVREIVAILNLPSPKFIDTRFERLADFWVNVERRGKARIYQKKVHRIQKSIYYETLQVLHWPNMDGSDTFSEMDRLKWDHIDDDSGTSGWIPRKEMEEKLQKVEKNTRMEVRDQFLRALYNETALEAPDIEQLSNVDIKAARIRQIGNQTS